MPTAERIDWMLAMLNAADVGSLDSVAAKIRQVQEELEARGEAELAKGAADAAAALGRGDVAEFRRGRAFLPNRRSGTSDSPDVPVLHLSPQGRRTVGVPASFGPARASQTGVVRSEDPWFKPRSTTRS